MKQIERKVKKKLEICIRWHLAMAKSITFYGGEDDGIDNEDGINDDV